MKKFHQIKQKIVFYVMSVAIFLAVLISIVMSIGNVRSTDTTLLDSMQTTARIASQSISSNLHLLTERIYNLSNEPVFTQDHATNVQKQAFIDEAKLQIEFVWLAAYDMSGKKLYGDKQAPDAITNEKYYTYLNQTNNLVIGEPHREDGLLQLCVGAPIKAEDETRGFLVGSYKYDLLNDVLSMLIVGNTGSACIINEDGLIIGDRDMEWMLGEETIQSRCSDSAKSKQVMNKILDYQTDSALIQMNGVQQYVGFSPIPGTNWTLLIHAPKREFMDTVIASIIVCVLLAILMLLIAAVSIMSVSKKISDSLSAATNRLQQLAVGNLTDEVIMSKSNDETIILTDALTKTIASLKTYIQTIESCLGSLSAGDYTIEIPDSFSGDFTSIRNSLYNITNSLNQTMQRMNLSSQEVNSNSVELSVCANQLEDASMNQEELLMRLEESVTLITQAIEKNRENVLQIEQCSENASEKTSQGADYMQHMLAMMEEINHSVEEIGKISKMINDISYQTHLLALNASIEAARAGEHGHGFAVVAVEIGELSQKTTDALEQTGEKLQRQAEAIQKGLETANDTAAAFQEIQKVTEQYHEISEQLASTVEEQTSAVAHVSEQLEAVRDIAAKNHELAEETNLMAASSLKQSQTLNEYVSQVKLRHDGKQQK